jgi:hypothetical protein
LAQLTDEAHAIDSLGPLIGRLGRRSQNGRPASTHGRKGLIGRVGRRIDDGFPFGRDGQKGGREMGISPRDAPRRHGLTHGREIFGVNQCRTMCPVGIERARARTRRERVMSSGPVGNRDRAGFFVA